MTFNESVEKAIEEAKEVDLFGELSWFDKLSSNVAAWVQIVLQRIREDEDD